jgi:isoquinoline 1-oxidoreductase subunit alpha
MISLTINGKPVETDASPDTPLLWVLRDQLGLTGTKFGCGIAECGACTVHLDGRAVRSCVTPLKRAAGRAVTTIEAMSAERVGSAVQQAWLKIDVPQ